MSRKHAPRKHSHWLPLAGEVNTMATGHQSIIERNFILQALKEEIRVDGRLSYDFRKIKITYGRAHGECNVELQLGQTRLTDERSRSFIIVLQGTGGCDFRGRTSISRPSC